MIRQHLFEKRIPSDRLFRWRGGEISRLEGLSDGVFAVTLSLVILSQSVPTTFHELYTAIRDLPVFLVCFLALMLAWRYHYMFFRRYGLEDLLTSVLNAALLFLIMFYAFPLKFLATFLWKEILGDPTAAMFVAPEGFNMALMDQRVYMMYFFGFGMVGVFGLQGLMVFRAWCLRGQLELDEVERFLTVSSIRSHSLSVGISVLSLSVLFLSAAPGWAGVTYFLMWPAHVIDGIATGVIAEKKAEALAKENPDEPAT